MHWKHNLFFNLYTSWDIGLLVYTAPYYLAVIIDVQLSEINA